MPIASTTAIVEGDEILIRATVQHAPRAADADLFAKAACGASLFVRREAAELVSTRISVGDEVCIDPVIDDGPDDTLQSPGIVTALVGKKAWVSYADGVDSVCTVDCLRRLRTKREIEDAAALAHHARAQDTSDRDAARVQAMRDEGAVLPGNPEAEAA